VSVKSKRGSRAPTMCYVVAYDIPDDRRRTKVHQILTGFGKWTQYSLFECFLSRRDLILLQSKLSEYLIDTQDSVRFYPLCANCVTRVETVGDPPPEDQILFIV
jgi:CRISPR-associated protein Cas2